MLEKLNNLNPWLIVTGALLLLVFACMACFFGTSILGLLSGEL